MSADLISRKAVLEAIENYRVPVGNSAAGEMACEWTTAALREIRNEIAEIASPTAEPAAWRAIINGVHERYFPFEPAEDFYDEGTLVPLYAAPQQPEVRPDDDLIGREVSVDAGNGPKGEERRLFGEVVGIGDDGALLVGCCEANYEVEQHAAMDEAAERAAFEHWASDNGEWLRAVERSGDGYKLVQTQSFWMAWQARAQLSGQQQGGGR